MVLIPIASYHKACNSCPAGNAAVPGPLGEVVTAMEEVGFSFDA